jgi:hypothetical protein
MQKMADELIANASKPVITTPPTVPPAIDPIATGPPIFVGLTTQPRPGTQLSPKSPFMNTSAPINFKYCALEQYVAEHHAHAYIANDVMPDLRTVLDWLKTLKGMHTATTKTRKECTIPHDAQSVGVMLQWLIQRRKSIGNIGRAQAAKEGTLPPMDAIHTDDEEPHASHKSHSKTASMSQGQDGLLHLPLRPQALLERDPTLGSTQKGSHPPGLEICSLSMTNSEIRPCGSLSEDVLC